MSASHKSPWTCQALIVAVQIHSLLCSHMLPLFVFALVSQKNRNISRVHKIIIQRRDWNMIDPRTRNWSKATPHMAHVLNVANSLVLRKPAAFGKPNTSKTVNANSNYFKASKSRTFYVNLQSNRKLKHFETIKTHKTLHRFAVTSKIQALRIH